MQSIVDCVKSALSDNNGEFKAATVELKRLEAVRQSIISERGVQAGRFRRYAEKLEERFKAMPTIEHEIAWMVALNLARDNKRTLDSHPVMFAKVFDEESKAVWVEFIKREPKWKEALETVTATRLETAEGELSRTESTVRNDLAGFDGEHVDADPRLKQARRRLGMARC